MSSGTKNEHVPAIHFELSRMGLLGGLSIVYFIMEKFQKYICHCSFEKTQNFQKFKNLIFERSGEIDFF